MNRLIALPLIALAACDQPTPVVLTPPPALLSCANEPTPPNLPTPERQRERDEMTLAYILALRSAWGDCRSKVDGVRSWTEEVNRGQ